MRVCLRRRLGSTLLAVLAAAVVVVGPLAGAAQAAPATASTIPVTSARLGSAPALGAIDRLDSAAFATADLAVLGGQSCRQTTGTACRGYVAITRDGGRTFTPVVEGGYAASRVAVSSGGRVWAWLTSPGCSPTGPCTSRLVTLVPGRSPQRTVLTTKALVTGLVAGARNAATIALAACTGRPTAQTQTCRGRLEATVDGGATWRTLWHASAWVGGLAEDAGTTWAVAAYAGPKYALRAVALRAPSPGAAFGAVGALVDAAYAGGIGWGVEATTAASGSRVWVAFSDAPSCAMHGCALSGLYRSIDGGHSWRAVPWAKAAGNCPMPGPQVAAWGDRVVASVVSNLAACRPPATAFVVAAANASTTTLASALPQADVSALGVIAPGRLWALTGQALLTSTDGGRTWRALWPSLGPTALVAFTSSARGLGIGSAVDPAAVLSTTDGGRTWARVGRLPATGLTALDVLSARVAYAAGYASPNAGQTSIVWRTADGGRTWQRIRTLPGDVLALSLDAGGSGELIVQPSTGSGALLEAIRAGTAGARTLRTSASLAQAAALGPDGAAYVATVGSPASGSVINIGRSGMPVLLTLPAVPAGWAAAMDAEGPSALVVAVALPYAPKGGSARFGNAERTEIVTGGGAGWRRLLLPEAAGAPTAMFFRTPESGWLLTSGAPGVSMLWHTSDGGSTWTAIDS